MVNNTHFFSNMPALVFGNMLDQLNQITGSRGVVNEADIPVVLRYTANLALTCKATNEKISNENVTDLFLRSLSHKYNKPYEHFVALWNTPRARKWLWSYIHRNGDYKAYQIIQKIMDIAFDVKFDVKAAGLKFWADKTPETILVNESQTKEGFLLHISGVPMSLSTPFGKIGIFGNHGGFVEDIFSVPEAFVMRLNGVIECFNDNYPPHLHEITPLSSVVRKIQNLKGLDFQDLSKKKGEQSLIVYNTMVCGTYRVREVEGEEISFSAYESKGSWRSCTLIEKIIHMLIQESLGFDPLVDLFTQNEKALPTKAILSIDSILSLPKAAAEHAEQLVQSPIRVEASEKEQDPPPELKWTQLVYLINTIVGKRKTFYEYNMLRNFLRNKLMSIPMEFTFSEKDANRRNADFESIIERISADWAQADFGDFPDIKYPKSEEDYVLFTREDREAELIGHLLVQLADVTGRSKLFDCFDKGSRVYLLIRRENMDETLNFLNMKYYSSSQGHNKGCQ